MLMRKPESCDVRSVIKGCSIEIYTGGVVLYDECHRNHLLYANPLVLVGFYTTFGCYADVMMMITGQG